MIDAWKDRGFAVREQLAMKDVFRFDEAGKLPRPGPIGRLVRFGMGAICTWWAWRLGWRADAGDLVLPAYWLWFLFALLLAPYVVNIGLGVRWGAWPRIAAAVAVAGAGLFGYLQTGSPLQHPLWLAMNAVMLYVYGHLGISFLLSASLATPGCEMRAIPQLLAILGRRDAAEHYCPGFIGNVDRWELERGSPTAKSERGDAERRDLLGSAGAMLLAYGVPYLAVHLAGNFGGSLVVTVVWVAAFTAMGVTCLINARRCGRVHCCFVGPWFLLAALATVLLELELLDLGASGWSTLVNVALFGAVLLYFVTEGTWGKYFEGLRRSRPA